MSLAGCSRSSTLIGHLCGEEAAAEEDKSDKVEWWHCSAPLPPLWCYKTVEHHHQIRAAVQTSPTQKHHQNLFPHLAQKGTMSSPRNPPEHEWINDMSVAIKTGFASFDLFSVWFCSWPLQGRGASLYHQIDSCFGIGSKYILNITNGLPYATCIFQGLTHVRGKAIPLFPPWAIRTFKWMLKPDFHQVILVCD